MKYEVIDRFDNTKSYGRFDGLENAGRCKQVLEDRGIETDIITVFAKGKGMDFERLRILLANAIMLAQEHSKYDMKDFCLFELGMTLEEYINITEDFGKVDIYE